MIRDTLRNLPEGLGDTYRRILTKISTSPSKAKLAQKVFTWATIARRPLHIEELREAVAIDPDDKSWDEDKFPHGDLMFESCKGLIIKNEDDETIHFAHHTVQQYLTSGLTTKVDPFFEISTLKANFLAGQILVAYLSFSDFETQITLNKPMATLESKGVLASGGPLWIPSTLGIRKTMFDIPYRLLRGDAAVRGLNPNYWKHLIPRAKTRHSPSTDLKQKYRLLCYAVEYWEPHTRSYEPSDSTINRRLEVLAMQKSLAFDFRPWGSNQHFGPYGCVGCPSPDAERLVAKDLLYVPMIHYAAKVGNLALLTSKFNIGDYLYHERYHQETLLIACRHNNVKIVHYLTEQATCDIDKWSVLNVTAAAGQVDVLQYLIRRYEYSLKENGDVPLLSAAKNGHDAAVMALLDAGADLSNYDEQIRRNIIESTAMNGHDQVIQVLGRKGAHNLFVKTETMALHFAAANGHVAATRALLGFGVRTSVVNSDELTPLHLAAEAGHSAVAEVLLGYGADPTFTPSRIEYIDDHLDGTPYHLATRRGHINILETFSKNYPIADIPPSSGGKTLLHLAASANQDKTIRWLVEQGAGINAVDKRDRTSLFYATEQGNDAAVHMLLELGARIINTRKGPADAMIIEAACDGKLPILRMLLENIRNELVFREDGDLIRRALHHADRLGSLEAANLLQKQLSLLHNVPSDHDS